MDNQSDCPVWILPTAACGTLKIRREQVADPWNARVAIFRHDAAFHKLLSTRCSKLIIEMIGANHLHLPRLDQTPELVSAKRAHRLPPSIAALTALSVVWNVNPRTLNEG